MGKPAARSASIDQTVELSSTSPSTLALLSIAQDITALVSLSVEATASLVHDWFRSSLLTIGIGRGQVVRYVPPAAKTYKARQGRGESGRGLAVVVIGAVEPAGQSLTLHLAKSGYTVFPLIPLPSPHSPPTSHALSSLLLMWSTAQKRLHNRYPDHSGSIEPIMTDPEGQTTSWSKEIKGKGKARFRHAGETVRAYIQENNLRLAAVICASGGLPATSAESQEEGYELDGRGQDLEAADSRVLKSGDELSVDTGEMEDVSGWQEGSPDLEMNEDYEEDTASTSKAVGATYDSLGFPLQQHQPGAIQQYHLTQSIPAPPSGLIGVDESALLALYRSNILDPLAVIREFQYLLVVPSNPDGRRGRVVFVNSSPDATENPGQEGSGGNDAANSVIGVARAETAKLLREELGEIGVDVCEVAVGPMAPRITSTGRHLRNISEDSAGSSQGAGRRKLMKRVLQKQNSINEHQADTDSSISLFDTITESSRADLLASRLALLAQLWAVDDALLYSSVRRAIEDRYPRAKHHAGLSPLIESVAGVVPGMGFVKALGRWVLGRLVPRRG